MLKIILVHFLGNSIKMCSNFSYFIFSITRLKLITKQNDRDSNTSSNHSNNNFLFFIYIFLLVLISCCLSLFKLFQYRKNVEFNILKEFPFEIRNEQYCVDRENPFECNLFNAFRMANRSLNDLLFVILNILIDCILLFKFRRIMNSKLSQIHD